MFNEYRIPRDNLISNHGDMTAEGEFITSIKDPKKQLGASFGSLSNGRVNISGEHILSILLTTRKYILISSIYVYVKASQMCT